MNTNKIITICFIAIIVILTIPTVFKVINNHHNNLVNVVEQKIINAAKKCYYEEICSEDTISLSTLYDNTYLEKLSNPLTKEYYNEESYIKKEGNKFTFVSVE